MNCLFYKVEWYKDLISGPMSLIRVLVFANQIGWIVFLTTYLSAVDYNYDKVIVTLSICSSIVPVYLFIGYEVLVFFLYNRPYERYFSNNDINSKVWTIFRIIYSMATITMFIIAVIYKSISTLFISWVLLFNYMTIEMCYSLSRCHKEHVYQEL